MELGELLIQFSGDFSKLENDIQKAKNQATKAAQSIEKEFKNLESLRIKVDDSALTSLNKHLDLKVKHFQQTQQYFNNNPLTIKVDDSALDSLNKKLDALESRQVNVNTSSSGGGGGQSSGSASLDASQESARKNTELLYKNIGRFAQFAAAPFESVGRGFFEGIGQNLSKNFSQSLQGNLEKSLNFSFKEIGSGTGDIVAESAKYINDKLNLNIKKNLLGSGSGGQLPASTLDIKTFGVDLGDEATKTSLAKIRSVISEKYKIFKQNLDAGNLDLAKRYGEEILKTSEELKKQINDIKNNTKFGGVPSQFGATVSTSIGSTKGNLTKTENLVQRGLAQVSGAQQLGATYGVGQDVIKGVAIGLGNKDLVIRQSAEIANSILITLKKELGIQSPSTKAIALMQFVGQGLVIGLKSSASLVAGESKKLAEASLGGLQAGVGNVNSALRARGFGKIRSQITAEKEAEMGSVEFFDGVWRNFGKEFRRKALKSGSTGSAKAMQNEIAGFMFSAGTLANPMAGAAGAIAPLAIPALPLITTGIGVAGIVQPLVDKIAKALEVVEPIRTRLEFSSGSSGGAQKEIGYVQKVATDYNVGVQPALENYSRLTIAAKGTKLEGEEIKKLFEGITASIGAMKLSTADADLVFYAYTQMLGKGKVSMEELRQQLGEKFPPTMNVFAKALGVSTAELDSLASKGALITEEVFPKLSKVLLADYGAAAKNQTGSYISALTRFQNVGFDVSLSLAESFGGLFASITNLGTGALSFFKDNLKTIQSLAGAGLIGIAAQFAVGLQTILSSPAIATRFGQIQNFILSSFKASFVALTPFFAGVIADVADDMLGAQHSILDNMSQGVTQAFTAFFGVLDDYSRTSFNKPLFSKSSEDKSFFDDLQKGAAGLFKLIPSGLVEIVALAVMFEQLITLGKLLAIPVFGGIGNALKGMSQAFVTAITSGDSLKGIFYTLFSSSTLLKGALVAVGIAAKLAFAALVVAFARSDFTNPIADAFGKLDESATTALRSIKKELNSLKEVSLNTGKSLSEAFTLPSKGLELNPGKLLGVDTKSFKTDDFYNAQNQGKIGGFFGTVFGSGLSDNERRYAESYKKKATGLGIGEFFSGTEKDITLSQKQLLNNASDIAKFSQNFQSNLKSISFGDLSKPLKDVRAIDTEIQRLSRTLSKTSLEDTTASKVKAKQIEVEINAQFLKRKNTAKPLESILGNVDSLKDDLKTYTDAINSSDLPKAAKQALLKILEVPKAQLQQTIDALTGAGLYQAIKPLEDSWKKIVDSMSDAEKIYTRNQNFSQVDYQKKQQQVYQVAPNQQFAANSLTQLSISESQAKAEKLRVYIANLQASLEGLLSIAGAQNTDDRKKTIQDLKDNILKSSQELNQTVLETDKQVSQVKFQIQDSNKAINNYYKGIERQSQELAATAKEITNDIALSKAKSKLKSAISEAQDDFIGQYVDNLIQILDVLNQPLKEKLQAESQLRQNYNALEDSRKQSEDIKKAIPQAYQASITSSSVSAGNQSLVFPLGGRSSSQISSGYGMRLHPISGINKFHDGVDYPASTGTPVVSPMAGIVTGVKYEKSGAGKYVVVESLDSQGRKVEHTFMHLDQQIVKEGQQVAAGQQVGTVGNTGRSTGAHLHYRTRINGQSVNPVDFLKSGTTGSASLQTSSIKSYTGSTKASFYGGGDGFQGSKTSTGEIFDENKMTAAINETLKKQLGIPFGTQVEITNPATGQSVVVRINDHGPYEPVKKGQPLVPHKSRGFDLSAGAARVIGLDKQGVGAVNFRVLGQKEPSVPQSSVQTSASTQASMSTGAQSQLSSADSLAVRNLEQQRQNIGAKYFSSKELSDMEARRLQNRNNAQLEKERVNLLRSTLPTDRSLEDAALNLGEPTFDTENLQKVIAAQRKNEDDIQSLQAQRDTVNNTLENAQALLDRLEKSTEAQVPFRQDSIARLKKLIPDVEFVRNKLNTQIKKTSLAGNAEIADLEQKIYQAEMLRLNESKDDFSKTKSELLKASASRRRLVAERRTLNLSDLNLTLSLEKQAGFLDAKVAYRENIRAINETIKKETNKDILRLLNDKKRQAFAALLGARSEIQIKGDRERLDRQLAEREESGGRLDKLSESRKAILSERSTLLGRFGLGTIANPLNRRIAMMGAADEYRKGSLEIDQLGASGKYSNKELAELRKNLESLNKIKLRNIRAEFDTWTGVMESTKGQFEGFFGSVIRGTSTLEEAFSNLIGGIADNLANLASQYLTNEIFGSIFGMNNKVAPQESKGGGLFGGGIGGILGGLLGFANGGEIGNYASGGIIGAMQRERAMTGRRAHLIVASEGERVLNHKEAKIWNKITGRLNFADGGMIGSEAGIISSATTVGLSINIPINVGSESKGVFDKGKENALRQAIISTVVNERRPGGSLYQV
jgi:rare lipoprotein A